MLHAESVEQSTLELLVQLQKQEYLSGFHLAGGTALALKMGHRKSIDIDLFSNFSFDVGNLLENLSADFSFNLFFSAKNTIKGKGFKGKGVSSGLSPKELVSTIIYLALDAHKDKTGPL